MVRQNGRDGTLGGEIRVLASLTPVIILSP